MAFLKLVHIQTQVAHQNAASQRGVKTQQLSPVRSINQVLVGFATEKRCIFSPEPLAQRSG